jgi:hypothetical protein
MSTVWRVTSKMHEILCDSESVARAWERALEVEERCEVLVEELELEQTAPFTDARGRIDWAHRARILAIRRGD